MSMEQNCKVCGGPHITGACTEGKNTHPFDNAMTIDVPAESTESAKKRLGEDLKREAKADLKSLLEILKGDIPVNSAPDYVQNLALKMEGYKLSPEELIQSVEESLQ